MKKIGILVGIMLSLVCGCGKTSKDEIIKDFTNKVNNTKSYILTGNMEISNDEETFTYSIESYYLKDDFYKVKLVNLLNNHEQIILKNEEGIYVITPALNKSFKFQSDWPKNSSQAYMLNNLAIDMENDKEKEIKKIKNGYIIKTKVNYPNNEELVYQKVYLSNEKIVEKVEVYNNNDIVKIKVSFNKIDLKAKLKESNFRLDEYVKEEKCDNSECNKNDKSEEKEKASINIDNIIYPLYIPANTYLTSSEKVETGLGNRVILTFSGEKNFVLIEEASVVNDELEIIPVYGEPFLLSESVGALGANSLCWEANNISYYLASTELTVSEMKSIANSLGNATIVAKTK